MRRAVVAAVAALVFLPFVSADNTSLRAQRALDEQTEAQAEAAASPGLAAAVVSCPAGWTLYRQVLCIVL